MLKIYNTVGSLTTLKSHLSKNKIHDFKSLKEIVDFKNSYSSHRQQVIAHYERLVEQERIMLESDLQKLEKTVETQRQKTIQQLTLKIDRLQNKLDALETATSKNIWQKIVKGLRGGYYSKKIKKNKRNFDANVEKSIAELVDTQQNKSKRHQFLTSQFRLAVNTSSKSALTELERKKSVIDELSSFIYGALGEQKVVKTLGNLSDEYFLLNDFAVSFAKPIYNQQKKEYIKSIQIDHILIGPSGVFLIETKNWSKSSLENLSLRSPVEQTRRSNYALFRLLNSKRLSLNKHHWGKKKITIRNLIVFVNTKPRQEFQFVKIVTVKELLGYINYFNPQFSKAEVQRITDYLIQLNNRKTVSLK